MKQVNVTISGLPLDYEMANNVARSVALLLEKEPTVVAWYDAPDQRMSPVIEGADLANRWRDYGESHGGDFAVSVNGEYDFIFADSTNFDKLERSPYISVHDRQGNEFLCLAEDLRDPSNPMADACFSIENTQGYSAMHEG